jgi:hypothetical protein
MKKLKRLSIIELGIGKEFEVLSDCEKRLVIAGDGTWDCAFNTFINYMITQGHFLDKNQVINDYISYSGISQAQIIQDGGVAYGSFSSYLTSKYQMNMNQVYFMPDSSSTSFANNHVVAINIDGGNADHIIRPLTVSKGLDQFGNSITYVYVFDPSKPQGQQYYNVKWSDVKAIFAFGTEDTYGQPGYFGYGENGISYGYDAYQYGYEYDGYYGYGSYNY